MGINMTMTLATCIRSYVVQGWERHELCVAGGYSAEQTENVNGWLFRCSSHHSADGPCSSLRVM